MNHHWRHEFSELTLVSGNCVKSANDSSPRFGGSTYVSTDDILKLLSEILGGGSSGGLTDASFSWEFDNFIR